MAPQGIVVRRYGRGFNDDHIAAIAQAVCEHRAAAGVDGPLYLGRDTHALSEPAFITVLEVLAANDVDVLVDSHDGTVALRRRASSP